MVDEVIDTRYTDEITLCPANFSSFCRQVYGEISAIGSREYRGVTITARESDEEMSWLIDDGRITWW